MVEQNTRENEMEIRIENCDITEWKMDKQSCWMEPWAEF